METGSRPSSTDAPDFRGLRSGGILKALFAGAVVALILAGTETVASYPRPSTASGSFFFSALVLYFPIATTLAAAFQSAFGRRGLDLWLPFTVGLLRLAGSPGQAVRAGDWSLFVGVLLGLAVVLGVRAISESRSQSPPFLVGLTVGIVLPILMARVFPAIGASRYGDPGRLLALGCLVGLLGFIVLRAFVARWPQFGPVFLLGPVVSLALWSHESPPAAREGVAPPGSSRQPDIVLIVLDTTRAQALRSYGHSRDTMPNLEAFARDSTTFRRAWSDGSWTLPAHASLFSGLRLTRHRYDSGFSPSERANPDDFLAARLSRAGYRTGAVAANFGVFGREAPLLRGFEHVDAEPLRPFAFRPWFFDLLSWAPRAGVMRPFADRFPGPSMRAPWVVKRALDFWTRSGEGPRFLFVNLMEAHLPWIPEPADLGRFGPAGLEVEPEQVEVLGRYLKGGRPTPDEVTLLGARYDEALSSLDRSLGRLLDGLGRGRDGREAIVVVTSDHGESLGEHDRFGHRNSVDEEAIRIPLFIRGPDLRAGEVQEAPVQLVDVFGYLAHAAGLEVRQGLDARPLGQRQAVVIEHRPGPQGALPSSYPRGDLSALVQWPYKYVSGPNVAAALFDLSIDPAETRNLANTEPSRAEAMRGLLRELSGPLSSPRPIPDRETEERLRALGYVR